MKKEHGKGLNVRKFAAGLLAITMLFSVLLLSGCASRDADLVGRWVFDDNPAL